MSQTIVSSAAADAPVHLGAGAARRVQSVAAQQGKAGLMLRLTVDGGGCSGFSYRFGFADAVEPDDVVVERDGVRLVVDEASLPLVAGATIDFVEDLMGAYFKVENPNAASSCGCGTSFAPK